MLDTKKLHKELRAIASEKDPRKVLGSLEYIRETLARETTPYRDVRDHMLAKIPATELLVEASKVARRDGSRHELLRLAARAMGQSGTAGAIDCKFAVRYGFKGNKRHELQLVGPLNAQPGFLVAYAFFLLAKEFRVSAWIRPKRKRCGLPGCKNLVPVAGTGRPRYYCCPEHQVANKRSAKR